MYSPSESWIMFQDHSKGDCYEKEIRSSCFLCFDHS